MLDKTATQQETKELKARWESMSETPRGQFHDLYLPHKKIDLNEDTRKQN